jgi:hypothetical protein
MNQMRTALILVFSAPVLQAPPTPVPAAMTSVSGNTLAATFTPSHTPPPNGYFWFSNIPVKLKQSGEGDLVTVSITASPAGAVTFVRAATLTLGCVDHQACQPPPRGLPQPKTTAVPVKVGLATIGGAHPQDFKIIANACDGAIAPPGCGILVAFSPMATGTLSIGYGDSGCAPRVDLSGRARCAILSRRVLAIGLNSDKSLVAAIHLDGPLAGPIGCIPGYPARPAKAGHIMQILQPVRAQWTCRPWEAVTTHMTLFDERPQPRLYSSAVCQQQMYNSPAWRHPWSV